MNRIITKFLIILVRYDICHFLFMNLLMKHKIAFGYIILLIVIAVAAFTVINEHIRLNKFKKDIGSFVGCSTGNIYRASSNYNTCDIWRISYYMVK